MRKWPLAMLFCVMLAAPSAAGAQTYDLVFSVDGWPKMGTRADGKLEAHSFHLQAQPADASSGAKPRLQDVHLALIHTEAAAIFMRTSLEGRLLKTVLVEGLPSNSAKPPSRAPFAARLSDVRVMSVSIAGSRQGSIVTSVTLRPAKVEIFTAAQTATGAMQPGQQFGWDVRANKGM